MRAAAFLALALLWAAPATAQSASDRWEKFVAAFEAADKANAPTTDEVVFVGSSTMKRWDTAAYEVIRAYCERDDRLAFLDFDGLMLGWDEKPRRELFVEDGLHMSPAGYQMWTTVLRPWLLAP